MSETTSTREAGSPRVLRSVSVVSLMTAISRAGGLVREVVMAYYFGTSALKSAFDIAFVVPNLFRRLFGEGALSSAFVPVFSETLEREGRAAAQAFARRMITLLGLFLGTVTLAGVLATYPLARLLPADSHWLLPLPMLRVMLPYALLICVAALLSGMLNVLGRFAVSSLTPFLLNLVWILTLVGVFPFLRAEPSFRILVLSWMILLAGLAQILFQLPALRRDGFRLGLSFGAFARDERLRRVLTLMGPAALGLGLIQINVCVDKLLAFWADASAPAALEYAERIVYLPLGMFGTAFMTVLLPTFSRQAARGDLPGLSATLERSLRNLSVIMAPCSAALAVLALPCIELIYSIRGGQFSAGAEGDGVSSAVLSARALAAYAPGLLVFSFQKALTPAFYGMQDLRTPVRVSLSGLALNVVLNVASVLLLPAGWKHVGIAGATVLTSAVNTVMLAVLLRRRVGAPRGAGYAGTLVKACVAALAMALAARLTQGAVEQAACGGGWPVKAAQLAAMAAAVAVAAAVYVGALSLAAPQALQEMWGEFRRGRRKGATDGE